MPSEYNLCRQTTRRNPQISPALSVNAPTRVLLIRHAETAAPNVFHGAESDIGLSEKGLRDSEAIAPILALERPVAIISSAMKRAVETATPIARACDLPVTIESALHERRIGPLAGQRYDANKGPWAETLRRWQAGDLDYAANEGAESFLAVRDRVLPVWNRLAESYAGQTYLIVAHGAVIKILLLSLDFGIRMDAPVWDDFSCPNLRPYQLAMIQGSWYLDWNRNPDDHCVGIK